MSICAYNYLDEWRERRYVMADGPGTNTGHGHVWPRPDGARARCGGPAICAECSRDGWGLRLREVEQSRRKQEDEAAAQIAVLTEALRRYGEHEVAICDSWANFTAGAVRLSEATCTCGLSAVLANLPAAVAAHIAQDKARDEGLVSKVWRVRPDVDGGGGETWASYACDISMQMISNLTFLRTMLDQAEPHWILAQRIDSMLAGPEIADAGRIATARLEVLQAVEWGTSDMTREEQCPFCWGFKREGHAADCRLKKALNP